MIRLISIIIMLIIVYAFGFLCIHIFGPIIGILIALIVISEWDEIIEKL